MDIPSYVIVSFQIHLNLSFLLMDVVEDRLSDPNVWKMISDSSRETVTSTLMLTLRAKYEQYGEEGIATKEARIGTYIKNRIDDVRDRAWALASITSIRMPSSL